MFDKILEIFYYIFYAVELFLVGDGIFHNRVREKAKYAVMAGAYLLVTISAVLFFEHDNDHMEWDLTVGNYYGDARVSGR